MNAKKWSSRIFQENSNFDFISNFIYKKQLSLKLVTKQYLKFAFLDLHETYSVHSKYDKGDYHVFDDGENFSFLFYKHFL